MLVLVENTTAIGVVERMDRGRQVTGPACTAPLTCFNAR